MDGIRPMTDLESALMTQVLTLRRHVIIDKNHELVEVLDYDVYRDKYTEQ
jgi:hypothetical protein